MPHYTFVVMTNAVDGRDDEFNKWYDGQHVRDVLDIPGMMSAQRFKLSSVQRMKASCPYRYLALYEIETDNLQAVMDELGSRSGTAAMPLSDSLSSDRFAYVFEPMSGKP